MGKSIAVKRLIVQKLALVVVILIFSVINIYIKGKGKIDHETEQSDGQSTTSLDKENIKEVSANQMVGSKFRLFNKQSNSGQLDGKSPINQLNLAQSLAVKIRRKRRNLLSIDYEKGPLSLSLLQSTSSVADETNGEIKVNNISEPVQPKVTKPSRKKSKHKQKQKQVEGEGTTTATSSSTSTETSQTINGTEPEAVTNKTETKSKKRKTKTGKKKLIPSPGSIGQSIETKSSNESENSNSTSKTPETPVTTRIHAAPPKTIIPLLKNVKIKECTAPAFKEFPTDIFGHKARKHGAIIIHIAVACYMFYCLAIVCDHYFLTSLEECAIRLNLSNDVAGATLMAAGSSAPELFTAILGVFVAKGDVGTGTIVGSAVFNILFVIGLCGVLTTATVLTWWPVARDSTYYTFTVLVLILVAYDGEVTTFESALMLIFYVGYIVVMHFNHQIRDLVTAKLMDKGYLSNLPEPGEVDEIKPQNSVAYYQSMQVDEWSYNNNQPTSNYNNYNSYNQQYSGYSGLAPSMDPNKTSLYEAAQIVIIKHKRLFPAITRFRAAANYTISINRKRHGKSQKQRRQEFNYKAREDGDHASGLSKVAHERITSSPNVEDWSLVPNPVVEGWLPVLRWCIIAPLHATLFYTIPNCKTRTNLYLVTFLMSVFWIAIFSYIMVWMVTLVGFTLGIPDSIMGITFLAAGTSIPDAYASIHVARQGQGDMAVSNSIGSNVFDILVGLALPWFVETALWQPGTTASINSRGLFYAIILLFLSLLVTIYLFHRNRWTLNPKLGYALLATYAVFLVFCGALELNLLGYVNPVMCEE
ncbi:sodium/potassium/calcium exchanger 4 isoform X1 [Tetranychus urticae]|nr:sodium/potassium/calcium exchanger 4 isoform X1 [Tetranychus urticae]